MKTLSRSFIIIVLTVASFAAFAQHAYVKEGSIIPPGRNILMQPMMNALKPAKGKIVVDIVIDGRGDVVSARANRLRTTIKDHSFIRSCERTIRDDMKFNKVKHGGPERQSGSLTYWFR